MIPPELFGYIKSRLNITWDDPHTDANIAGIIEEGVEYLNGKYGELANYQVAGAPRRLLVEYCRYARDDAMDVFEANYLNQILAMQNERLVEAYAENTLPGC